MSPLDLSEGIVVVDGSFPFPGIGLLETPVRLYVEGGSIVRFAGERAVVEKLEALFAEVGSPRATPANAASGVYLDAELTGSMVYRRGDPRNHALRFFGSSTRHGRRRERRIVPPRFRLRRRSKSTATLNAPGRRGGP